jgi:hypothetical protein
MSCKHKVKDGTEPCAPDCDKTYVLKADTANFFGEAGDLNVAPFDQDPILCESCARKVDELTRALMRDTVARLFMTGKVQEA